MSIEIKRIDGTVAYESQSATSLFQSSPACEGGCCGNLLGFGSFASR